MRFELATRQCKTLGLREKKVAKIQTSAQNGCRQERASGSKGKVYSARRIPSTIADGSTAYVGISYLRRLEEVGYVTNVKQDVSRFTRLCSWKKTISHSSNAHDSNANATTARVTYETHSEEEKTTKHGRRRVTENQHPYDRWVKMRSEMQEADIDRKTLIQKIADFLPKVLHNSNVHPEQTMAARPPPPPTESPDAQADFKSDAPAFPTAPTFVPGESESLFASPIKRSLSADSEDEWAASYIPGESSVRAFSARHFGAVASPYVSAYVYRTGNLYRYFGMRRDADGSFRIGNADVRYRPGFTVFVKGKSYRGREGCLNC